MVAHALCRERSNHFIKFTCFWCISTRWIALAKSYTFHVTAFLYVYGQVAFKLFTLRDHFKLQMLFVLHH